MLANRKVRLRYIYYYLMEVEAGKKTTRRSVGKTFKSVGKINKTDPDEADRNEPPIIHYCVRKKDVRSLFL